MQIIGTKEIVCIEKSSTPRGLVWDRSRFRRDVIWKHSIRRGIQDSLGFWIPRWGFRIPVASGIPDSLTCIPDSEARIPDHPQVKIFRIPNLTRKNILDSLAWGELKYTQLPMNRKLFIVNCRRNKFSFYYYAYTPKRILALAGFYLAVCFCAAWGRQSSLRFLYQTLRISPSLQRYVLSSCDYRAYIFVALIQNLNTAPPARVARMHRAPYFPFSLPAPLWTPTRQFK